jgi:DnaK suppressor protein
MGWGITAGVKGRTSMHNAELKHFKAALHAMLDGTEATLRRRDEIAVENAPDSLDRIQGATERELATRRIESDFTLQQSVRTALLRIAEGSYGICFRCEIEIPVKRLRAVPWAAYCLECQNSADRQTMGSDKGELAGVFHL